MIKKTKKQLLLPINFLRLRLGQFHEPQPAQVNRAHRCWKSSSIHFQRTENENISGKGNDFKCICISYLIILNSLLHYPCIRRGRVTQLPPAQIISNPKRFSHFIVKQYSHVAKRGVRVASGGNTLQTYDHTNVYSVHLLTEKQQRVHSSIFSRTLRHTLSQKITHINRVWSSSLDFGEH